MAGLGFGLELGLGLGPGFRIRISRLSSVRVRASIREV